MVREVAATTACVAEALGGGRSAGGVAVSELGLLAGGRGCTARRGVLAIRLGLPAARASAAAAAGDGPLLAPGGGGCALGSGTVGLGLGGCTESFTSPVAD